MNGKYNSNPVQVFAIQCAGATDVAMADGVHVAPKDSWILQEESGKKLICPDDVFRALFTPAPVSEPIAPDGSRD